MKNIIVFAGSSSTTSINKQLAIYASSLLDNCKVTVLDLNNFELPLFNIELETKTGIPEKAYHFLEALKTSDGIILALAEHNGAYTSVFKNIFDWMSRIESKLFYGKPMLLMATSPGERGGQSVLNIAKDRFPRHDAQIISEFSLPSFGNNFSDGKIIDKNLDLILKTKVETFQKAV